MLSYYILLKQESTNINLRKQGSEIKDRLCKITQETRLSV